MQQRKTIRKHHALVYWWSEEIASLRRTCLRARRLVQRARGTANRKKALKLAICPECGSGNVEDVQLVLFECRRFGYDRQILMETTGARVRPKTFVPLTLLKEANWEATLRRTDNERREATA